MDRARAKEILRLYRPGVTEVDDAEMVEALALAKQDGELGRWLKEYVDLQEAIRAKFRQTPVPEGLKEQIISERKATLQMQTRRRTVAVALALAVVLGVVLLPRVFMRSNNPREDISFGAFRQWTAGLVMRYPKMDLETNQITPIKEMVQRREGTFSLPKGLEATTPTGCATNLMAWNGHPVAMICFHSGKTSNPTEPDLFLFMTDRAAVTNAPEPNAMQFAKLAKLTTVSWSEGDKTYVLGARGSEEELRRYF